MARREGEKLERRDMVLYVGDWDELGELLAPTRITRTEFIRLLLRRTIRRIQAAKAGMERPVEDIEDDKLIDNIERAAGPNTELPAQGNQS